MRRTFLFVCLAMLCAAVAAPAQQPAGTDDGAGDGIYRQHCAACHGPGGRGGRGVDLAKPELERVDHDAALHELIREGISGTEMPGSFQLTDDEIVTIAGFLDGIPPTRTAAMPDPYLPDAEHGKTFTGNLIHTAEDLTRDVTALDAQGLTVKIHATGDRAVRVALDAFEAARKANGPSDRRHEISHAELVHASDMPRFKALDVVAEMCPILWYRSPLVDVMAKVVGEEKANRFWPTETLLEAGALVIFGSDWPSVVPDPSPWSSIESMVTRRDPYTNTGPLLWPEQAIDLASVIRIFTHNGAIAARIGDDSGSIEAGKSADFIILDRNIFKIPIEQVSDTKVLSTVIRGREVYAASAISQ